jgi:hypothetical protein
MKNTILICFLTISFFGLGQTDSDRQVILNSLNNSILDSILNYVTPTYANHNKYVSRMLDVLYAKDFDVILGMVKTKGFNGLYYQNEYDGIYLNGNTSSDSIVNVLNEFVKNLPKNKSKVVMKIEKLQALNDNVVLEEYTYTKNGTTYFFGFGFSNTQMNGMYVNIHSKY